MWAGRCAESARQRRRRGALMVGRPRAAVTCARARTRGHAVLRAQASDEDCCIFAEVSMCLCVRFAEGGEVWVMYNWVSELRGLEKGQLMRERLWPRIVHDCSMGEVEVFTRG